MLHSLMTDGDEEMVQLKGNLTSLEIFLTNQVEPNTVENLRKKKLPYE
jgi:hypothetical protein